MTRAAKDGNTKDGWMSIKVGAPRAATLLATVLADGRGEDDGDRIELDVEPVLVSVTSLL